MAVHLTPDMILQLRMSALGLDIDTVESQPDVRSARSSNAARIAATASRMLAIQGQDWRSARWALGVRTPNTEVEDVHEAFNEGLIVRSWPMRGTLHVLAAEDIGWMQRATNRRVLSGAAKRRQFLGMSDDALDDLVETSLAALRGGKSLDREELSSAWTAAGIEWQNSWRYHLIWWLCQNGLTVMGPVSDRGEPRLVLAGEWIAAPRNIDGEEALRELATRYAAARGAVTAQDLAWWSGLTAREAKTGLTLATEKGQLVEVATTRAEKTVTLWADPRLLNTYTHTSHDDWLLLPSFDEHLLGYQDRTAQLNPEHFGHIVPGRNGMFLATIVRDGRVVGTWKKGSRKGDGLVGTPLPDENLSDGAIPLRHRANAWAAFHGFGDIHFGTATASA